MSLTSLSPDARFGKVQLFSTTSDVFISDVEWNGTAIGAGLGILVGFSVNSGSSLMPRSPTRSASLPQVLAVIARRGAVVERSRLLCPPVLSNRKRCFFAPRSRTKEPKTSALETAAAASISREAKSERNC